MNQLGWLTTLCLLFGSLSAESKRSKYFIAIKKNEGEILSTLKTYLPFLAPKNRFYADPILFKHNDINYVFFEDFDYKKGVISYIEPNWAPGLDGTHSYSQNEDLVVYDGRRTIYPSEDVQYSSMDSE